MSYLTVKNLSHAFFEEQQIKEIFHDISFTIEKGEFISLLGPSGCGKTTILSIIAGLLSPLQGKIEHEDTTGYMLQQDYLFPWKTIEENCAIGLKTMGRYTDTSQVAIHQLLQQVGLQGTENLYPKQLSGGMRQRA